MAGFEQTVAVPSTSSYAAPLLDFLPVSNLANSYYQGVFNKQQRGLNDQTQEMNRYRIAEAQRQQDIAQTFQGGLPRNADGSIDYSKAVAMLAQKGDVGALWNGADAMLLQQAAKGSALLNGGPQPQTPAAAPQGAPAPRVPVQSGVQGDAGSGTIASLVTDRFPNQDTTTGQTIAKIASVMGVDPNATLTPGQVRRAQGLLAKYAPAEGGGGAATPAQRVAGAFDRLPPSANAGTPAATPPQGAPNGAGSPAPGPQAAPPPQAAPAAPVAPVAPPAGQPIVPQVPLPRGYTDAQAAILALRAEAARLSANPRAHGQVAELNNWAQRIEQSIQPVKMGPNDSYLDPRTGQVIAEGPAAAGIRAAESAANSPTVDANAEVYRQTGKLPPNLSKNLMGQAESRAIIARARELEVASGGDPSNWPQKWQNYQVAATGKRVLEQRAANLRLVENETATLIPRVRDISAKVSRTEYPSINSLILAARKGSGDPNVIKLGIAFESLIPVYARLLKPTGQITEGDTKRSHDILDKAWSDGQVQAALDQMEVERDGAREALDRTLEEVRGGGKSSERSSKNETAPKAAAKVSTDGWTVVTAPNGKKARIQEITED